MRAWRKSPESGLCHPFPALRDSAVILTTDKASSVRELYHMSSYFLAAGVPIALLFGAPFSTAVDFSLGVVLPLHMHIGMRSVLADYLPHMGVTDATSQKICIQILGLTTAVTALALTKFNLTDVGITEAVKSLWIERE